jgi:hypothetical protein
VPDQWFDRAAGPVVRPYALIGGRTRPTGDVIDLLAVVIPTSWPTESLLLQPEYLEVLRQCRQPKSVAELASDIDLPLGVVRILLSDMREHRLIMIRPPARHPTTDPQVLKDVVDGLRRL